MEPDGRSGFDCGRQPGGSDGVQAGRSGAEGIRIRAYTWATAGTFGGNLKESDRCTEGISGSPDAVREGRTGSS